ncbi:MAG: hypothetical protein JSU93_06565 [Methanobacteriota archaeon]|nr:MAG: hypothetical protein JSU93_06565 [Euryarchaeota archaeon]
MKDRILSVAIALSLIAVMFVVAPSSTEAAISYTGEVQTTDDTGDPIDSCFRGDDLYVLVETYYRGNATNMSFLVELRTQTGNLRDSFTDVTGDPDTGVFESWAAIPEVALWTGSWFEGELTVYDVILYVDDGGWIEVDRTQIIVRNTGTFLDPDTGMYYPGQEVSLTIVTTNTDDFYVQVVNETWVDVMNRSNIEVNESVDWTWHYTWLIPPGTPDGTYTLNVRFEDNNGIWPIAIYTKTFNINKYVLLVDSQSEYVLPGQTVSMLYDVLDFATLTHYAGAAIEWSATWTDVDDEIVNESGMLEGSSGVFDYVVDTDIALYSDIEMTFWANESDDRSAEDYVELSVGTMWVDVDISDDTFTPGEIVGVAVSVMVGLDPSDPWMVESLPGADIDIVVTKDGAVLADYGKAGMVTDVTGMVEYEFTLDDNATRGTYVIAATISYLDYEIERMVVFNVEWWGYMVVEFNKDYYYSGQIAMIDFKVVWNGAEINGTPVYYIIEGEDGVLATGNSTDGSAWYQILGSYVGDIEVTAITMVEGYYFEDWDMAEVRLADLALYPVAEYFRAGDTVTWMYKLSSEMSNGTITYYVVDGDGLKVDSGTIMFAKSGSFEFVVPEDPSDMYTATLTVDDNRGHIVSADSTIWLWANYELHIWLESGAGYTSRAYEPGSTLVFGYSIMAVGTEHLDAYRISFYATDEYLDGNVLVTETTGTFEYKLQDSVADGEYTMNAWLADPSEPGWLSFDSVSFDVKTGQSLWDKSVGGLSLFETVVLLLLLIMVILLVLVPMIKARMEAKPKGPETSMPVELDEPPPPAEEVGSEEKPPS